jgi:hypothetical protein
MQDVKKKTSRKKFLIWTTSIVSSFAAFKIFGAKPKKQTVRMLAEDGSLVEIDSSLLVSKGKKITDKELQAWVKNKPANN